MVNKLIKVKNKIVNKYKDYLPLSFLEKLEFEPRKKKLGICNGKVPLFNTVYFQVRTKCNGVCSFCRASVQNDTREDIEMPRDIYLKVIKELKELNFKGTVAYHVNNEPLIFSNLIEFVEIARNELPKAWLQILSNGRALNKRIGSSLLGARINEMSINYYNDDFDTPLPKNIIKFSKEILPKFYYKDKIKKGHRNNSDLPGEVFKFNVYRRRATDILTSRGGTAPNKMRVKRVPKGFCEYPFTQLNINVDGKVSKCCADFYFSDPMGDVRESSVMEIWYGDKFNIVRKNLMKGIRANLYNCKECDFIGVKI